MKRKRRRKKRKKRRRRNEKNAKKKKEKKEKRKKGKNEKRKPSARLLWDRFPKFVLGFIVASLVFSLFFSPEEAKSLGKISKGFSNTLFSVAFVCIGLETNFKELFTQENRKPLKAFLIAQGFNIIVTLIVAFLLFGILMNY